MNFASRTVRTFSSRAHTLSVAARPSHKASQQGVGVVALAAAVAAGAAATADSPAKNDSVMDMLESIKADVAAIKASIGASGGASEDYSSILSKIKEIKSSHPGNLAVGLFDEAYFNTLDAKGKAELLKIVKSGTDNADSGMGCYAMNPVDYDKYLPFFNAVIKAYHKIPGDIKHITNWDLSTPAVACKLPPGGKLDLAALGLGLTSMRVRVGRNLADFPLPGAMTREDRLAMEATMVGAFKNLIADPKFGGGYYSLTPGSDYEISPAFYKELVKKHIMFKDMADDSYLASAGIASDWPYGRGCYVSADKQFIVWVGEEDHLRIMCMKKGYVLNEVFDRLKDACDVVESVSGKFAHSDKFGYVTSCPTNLGTGMRASIHIKVPNLTKDGTDTKAKAVLKPLGLSVRGLGGEHTPIGADGTIDVSPSARLMIQEAEIITALYEGIEKVIAAENAAK